MPDGHRNGAAGIGLSLGQIAHALAGSVVGRRVAFPPPGHSAVDRSAILFLDRDAPEGFYVHTFSPADDPLQVRDYVRSRLGLDVEGWRRSRRDTAPDPAREAARRRAAERDEVDRAARRERALEVWAEGGSPVGTLVERYLNSRMIELDDDVALDVLRFHPACPFGRDERGELLRLPAMVALMRNIATDEPQAIHRTALSDDGRKIDRMMLAPVHGCAVKLDGDPVVTSSLTIGEGIETVMSARDLGLRPAWAMGSVGAIATFPVLAGVDALHLLEEADENGASRKAVQACGQRWHEAGREVRVVRPKRGKDLNDAVRGIGLEP